MEYEGRLIFLREFTRAAINRIPKKTEWLIPDPISIPKKASIMQPKPFTQQKSEKSSSIKPNLSPKLPAPTRIVTKPAISPAKQANKIPEKPAVIKSVPRATENSGPVLPKTGSKLMQFLKDPSVIGLECPGPDKNIVINRQGRIQPVQLTLKENEIKSILEEISSETKIPIINGLFKAAYKSFIITAVISDFVGTRFMIEKRPRLPETAIKR